MNHAIPQHLLLGFTGCALNTQQEPVGVKGVGKDTTSEILCQCMSTTHQSHHMSFADALKDTVSESYDLPRSFVDTPQMKETPLDQYQNWTYRQFLEVLGTDVVRQGLGSRLPRLKIDVNQTWLNKVLFRIQRLRLSPLMKLVATVFDLSDHELFAVSRDENLPRLGQSVSELEQALQVSMTEYKLPALPVERPTLVTVTDVRFFNEWQALKRMGGMIVQIQRTMPDMIKTDHPSNQVDPRMVPDLVIKNDGTEKELSVKVGNLASRLQGKRLMAPKPSRSSGTFETHCTQ